MSALIGVDIGTQGTKAAVMDESGECLARAFEASRLRRSAVGVVEEDPERQAASVCRTIASAVKQTKLGPSDVAGIGIAGQMAGGLGVDKDGRAATYYDSWLDTRCGPYIERMENAAGDEIVAKTGGPPSFNHGPKILWWKHERKAEYKRIAAFVQPGGYAAMRLCGLTGADAFIDTTYLHFSGWADNRRDCWDDGLCRRFAIDQTKLPRIVRPEQIVGQLTRPMARRCGLMPGVPVVAGCGDTAASFLACGATKVGVCVDVAGTASVFAATTDQFVADQTHRVLGCGQSAVPGLWQPYAYINGGGLNLEWFRKMIACSGGRRAPKSITLEQLGELADRVEPRDDLPMFIPHLGGRVSRPQPNLRGAWISLSWDDGLGELFRAVLEGVALEYVIYKNVLESLGDAAPLRELRITGGGQRSATWNQIKADALAMRVRRVTGGEGAPMGAALVAGFGVGVFKSLARAAGRWVKLEDAARPRRSQATFYSRRLKVYESMLSRLDGAMRT